MAEALASLLVSLVLVAFIAGIAGLIYKYRRPLKKWAKDEKYGSTWTPSRVTRAERELIKANWRVQDAEAYLGYCREKDAEEDNFQQEGGES